MNLGFIGTGEIAVALVTGSVPPSRVRSGTPVEVTHEAEFDAFWTVTSLMAPFYGLLDHGAAWLTGKGCRRRRLAAMSAPCSTRLRRTPGRQAPRASRA